MKANNKIIAEFMGDKPKELLYRNVYKDYESSWDLLMPVIEKIQDKFLEHPELEYEFDEIRLSVPDIQQTHYLITEFIKQYNDGKDK
jgi:pterin-4a-carbinolamine dehydratase|tara:strand:- start:43 stop:303 length:261 start_codon:yes stop_codon:yes gene_type:complete